MGSASAILFHLTSGASDTSWFLFLLSLSCYVCYDVPLCSQISPPASSALPQAPTYRYSCGASQWSRRQTLDFLYGQLEFALEIHSIISFVLSFIIHFLAICLHYSTVIILSTITSDLIFNNKEDVSNSRHLCNL